MGCGAVEIGELKKRIVIETVTQTSDGIGGFTETWATFVSAWASINPMKANEVFWAGHLEHRVTHKIMIRYQSGVLPKMRVSFGGRYFYIKGVRNIDEMNRFLELMCEEGVAA